MAELFEEHTKDFLSLVDDVRRSLAGLTPGRGADANLKVAETTAYEAEEAVAQMQIELQTFPASMRAPYAVKLREAKANMDKLWHEINSLRKGTYDPEIEGAGDGDADGGDQSGGREQRQRLLQGTARLERGVDRLHASHQLALQTEELGADILTDLRGQREQIEHARDTLHDADSSLDRSSRTLRRMIMTARKQKVATAAIIAVLVLLILLILYHKIF